MREILFPGPLKRGDAVAIVAPCGAMDPERADGAARALESFGLKVEMRGDMLSRERYLAGSDARRLEELREALLNPEIKAVFLARGGYGAQRIITGLELPACVTPKPVIGFSDNTAIHSALSRLGWASLHGPHPRLEKPEELREVLECLGLFGEPLMPSFGGLKTLGGAGAVEAPLAGGCLSILSTSVGTCFAFDFRGKIVFLEETGEAVYRIDRMLRHLVNSGSLIGALGVVFGLPETFLPEGGSIEDLSALLFQFASEMDLPVLAGLPCGHVEGNRPLPFGPVARLDADNGTLRFLEPLVK